MNTQVPQSLDADLDRVFKLGDEGPSPDADIADVGVDDTNNDEERDAGDLVTQPATQPKQDDDAAAALEAEAAGLRKNAQGQTVDKDGNVVAANREDRRVLFMYNKARQTMQHYRTERDNALQQLQGMREIIGIQQQFKLDNNALREAAQFRAQFDINPVQTVREIVAQAVANGYTMEQLFGPDAPAAINASVIQRTIDERLRPITERVTREQTEERATQEATDAFNDFLVNHEHADVHGNEIAHIVNTERVSPEVAYYKLQANAARLGLDFSQNLVEQMIAREQAASGKQPQRQQQTTQRMLPGNRTVGGNAAPANDPRTQVADPSMSFKDIVANAMRSVAARSVN